MCDKCYPDSNLQKNIKKLNIKASNCNCGCQGGSKKQIRYEPSNIKKVSVKKR